MKYDDASWHYDGDFPSGLPTEAGATHMGIFVAWCILHGMEGQLHTEESEGQLKRLKERLITPAQFVIEASDEKFTDEDLNDEGNAFATAYFGGDGNYEQYVIDYEETLAGQEETLYHVKDLWENFDKLSPIIEHRFAAWKDGKLESSPSKDFSLGEIVNSKPW